MVSTTVAVPPRANTTAHPVPTVRTRVNITRAARPVVRMGNTTQAAPVTNIPHRPHPGE